MVQRSVTVFGGTGFIGRHLVRRLMAQGDQVRLVTRDVGRAQALFPEAVGLLSVHGAGLGDEAALAQVLRGAQAVVYSVGILAERRPGDFQRVHTDAPARIAHLAQRLLQPLAEKPGPVEAIGAEERVGESDPGAVAGAPRFLLVSAIGAATDSPSVYGRTKAAGEVEVRAKFPTATILRPSIVFGPEDSFFNRFAGMVRLSPVVPVIAGATRFQPVFVGDVAAAALEALQRPDATGRVFELGGPRILSFRAVLEEVVALLGRRRLLLPVPDALAHLQALLCDYLPGKPLTRDQLAMLTRDNVVASGMPGLEALGITPTALESVVPGYISPRPML